MMLQRECAGKGCIYAGFDTQRTAHIWKIKVDPTAKTLNPPPGKPRDWKGPWRMTKENGRPFIDIMWSCGRTSWGDDGLAIGGGCHSNVLSELPGTLHFRNQKQIYDRIRLWQAPIKSGLIEAQKALNAADSRLSAGEGTLPAASQAQLMINQAQGIPVAIDWDGSYGVHAPAYTLGKVRQAKLLAEGALHLLSPETAERK